MFVSPREIFWPQALQAANFGSSLTETASLFDAMVLPPHTGSTSIMGLGTFVSTLVTVPPPHLLPPPRRTLVSRPEPNMPA